MTQYEYTHIHILEDVGANDRRLSDYGQMGWRLVHTGRLMFRLEREIIEPTPDRANSEAGMRVSGAAR
jgi:hypothetical protein